MKKEMLSILGKNGKGVSLSPSFRKAVVRNMGERNTNMPAPIFRICPCGEHRNDEARWSGFTLIELLVVVLIIGILAAVAVPQYQKAVLKSRAMQVIPYLKALKNAEEVYYLANGEYTNDINNLSVEVNAPTDWIIGLLGNNGVEKVEASYLEGGKWSIVANLDHRPEWAGVMSCWAKKGETKYEQVCKSMGNPLPNGADGFGTRWYIQQ